MLYLGLKAKERLQRATEALEIVGLGQRLSSTPNQLSGGQQQRVAIARALVNRPSIILADEPTGNLDSRTAIEVMDVFQFLNTDRGITIAVVTHEPDIAQYASRVVVFKDGKIKRDYRVPNRRSARAELESLPPRDLDEEDDE
jgi:putative ABC transport system ATP-binding protein